MCQNSKSIKNLDIFKVTPQSKIIQHKSKSIF